MDHDISDHKIIFIEIDNITTNIRSKIIPVNKIKLNLEKLKRSLVTEPIILKDDESMNNVYDEYSNELKNHLNRSSTVSKPKPKIQTQLKNWISNELLRTINAKNFWHKKIKENIRNHNLYDTEPFNENLRYEYCFWKNKVMQLKKSNFNDYYKLRFEDNANNPIQTWKFIKEIAYDAQTTSETQLSILNGNSLTSDSVTVAETFNDFFVNVGKDMSAGIVSYYDYGLNDYRESSFMDFLPLSEIGIRSIVSGLKNTTSVGYDQFSTKVIKECYEELKDCIKTNPL